MSTTRVMIKAVPFPGPRRVLRAASFVVTLALGTPAVAQSTGAQTTGAPASPSLSAAQGPATSDATASGDGASSQDTTSAALPSGKWMADVTAGYSGRDSGLGGAFAVAGVSRQLGQIYVRGAYTHYLSTFERSDTALPSTFDIGSLGVGGNFNNWVFDSWASYGWQTYGQVSSGHGLRESNSHRGSPYLALGGDFGRVFTLAPKWYLTPTATLSYTHTRLLRPGYALAGVHDFETEEPAWTGVGALRLDRRLGSTGQSFIGLSTSYHLTSNGLSVVEPALIDTIYTPRTVHYADGWEEVAGNASFQLTPRLWLDMNVTRSMGVRAGDSTTASGGFRLNF